MILRQLWQGCLETKLKAKPSLSLHKAHDSYSAIGTAKQKKARQNKGLPCDWFWVMNQESRISESIILYMSCCNAVGELHEDRTVCGVFPLF